MMKLGRSHFVLPQIEILAFTLLYRFIIVVGVVLFMGSTEEDVSTVVLAAEGALVEFASLSHSSGEQGLQAAAEEMLAEASESVCCRFAQRLNAANIESATSLLEIALSREFRKWVHFCNFLVLSLVVCRTRQGN